MSRGFLGTAAPRAADVVLVSELGMGAALIAGAVLARRRYYRAHASCQSAVVLLNLMVIAGFMAPSFHRQIGPEIPASLGQIRYAIAVAHGLLGTIAELLSLYIIVAAGTRMLPKQLHFRVIDGGCA